MEEAANSRLRQAVQGDHRLLGGLLRKKAAVAVQVGVDFLLDCDVRLHVVVEAVSVPSRVVQAVDYGILARESLRIPVSRVCRPPNGPRPRYKHIARAFMRAMFKRN
eukprot:3754379-Pleurochrysis_carterae.AAC.1